MIAKRRKLASYSLVTDFWRQIDDVCDQTTPPLEEKSADVSSYFPSFSGCRSVDEFHLIDRIDEGTFGVVHRAEDKRTNEIVALKQLKEVGGEFPSTSLREIHTSLRIANHPNVIAIREVVIDEGCIDKIFLVMDFVEFDLKRLIDSMHGPFLLGEIKLLMWQLLIGVRHLHDNWIVHRDLKTANLLVSSSGRLRIGDLGSSREYRTPPRVMTPVVVTLWYRAPELLLGAPDGYSTPIDIWSVGCVLGELLAMKPLFQGHSEAEELKMIFSNLGTPDKREWPGFRKLPLVAKLDLTKFDAGGNRLRKRFGTSLTNSGFELMTSMLKLQPEKRISADDALRHPWFEEEPRQVNEEWFSRSLADYANGQQRDQFVRHSAYPASRTDSYCLMCRTANRNSPSVKFTKSIAFCSHTFGHVSRCVLVLNHARIVLTLMLF